MSQPICQCEIPEDEEFVVCTRHGNIRKSRRQAELCNMGARGEAKGLPYWDAWEKGRGPGQKGGGPAEQPDHGFRRRRGNATKKAAGQRRKVARFPICQNCPDGQWNKETGTCLVLAPRQPCTMRNYFLSERRICKHWPESE